MWLAIFLLLKLKVRINNMFPGTAEEKWFGFIY